MFIGRLQWGWELLADIAQMENAAHPWNSPSPGDPIPPLKYRRFC